MANNTKAKEGAAQAHNKLTKIKRWQANNNQLQRRVFASINPKRMLQMAVSNVTQKLESNNKVSTISLDLQSTVTLAPRVKRQ